MTRDQFGLFTMFIMLLGFLVLILEDSFTMQIAAYIVLVLCEIVGASFLKEG